MMHIKILLPFLFCSLFFIGCQKETSVELSAPAKGSLKSSLTGDCNPITVKGVYKAGSGLADTNYVDIEVTVTKAGSYTISTDTVNGYSFKGTGNFTSAGTSQVRLKGSGKPLVAGDDVFEVTFDTTTCTFSIPVLPANIPSGPAVFTLSSASGNCMNAAVAGNFVKNVVLTNASTVTIEVNVTTPGSYTISTNAVNGIQFSGTGVFATAGVQTAVLKASGTPTNSGNFNFSVTAGSASCSFSVTVTDSPVSNNNDHFPLTANSWWSYEDVSLPGDSIKSENIYSKSFGANNYRGFISSDDLGPYDTAYYRKSGNDYYEYTLVDKLTGLSFDVPQPGEILFLKENLTTGTTWFSAEYSGNIGGQAGKLRYSFSCIDANASATINGHAFTNVYKIKIRPQVSALNVPFTDTQEEIETWFARGVGMIYIKFSFQGQVVETRIRNYKVF